MTAVYIHVAKFKVHTNDFYKGNAEDIHFQDYFFFALFPIGLPLQHTRCESREVAKGSVDLLDGLSSAGTKSLACRDAGLGIWHPWPSFNGC